ncbi:E3 SUMO-protein ligase ZBED1-like [Ochlerotatus camptorhynchus]|uniref:E3 SUMO-protein ligase ZBED1-like n=1 Tax=Ochlerotatus camptorhynchus TaxID=644619 RepID=UPI0031DF49E0
MSEVWNYFVKTSTVSAKCKICGSEVPRRGNTTNLKVHLQKHPQKDKTLRSQNASKCQDQEQDLAQPPTPSTSFASAEPSTSASTIDRMFKETQLWTDDGPKTREINEAIAFMIVKDYQPFSIVEDEGFVNLLKILAPKYKIPNRKLMTKLVDDKYSKVVECVKTKIQDKDLTITADIWTDSHTTRSYLGVTCHFLSPQISTSLQAIDLGVYIMNERHNSA